MSCSDQNMDVVIDLARHAQSCGADYIVVHAPILHFFKAQDDTLIRYYETIAAKVDIGIALWSHPDSGYLMSPQLCNRLADIETVVAIKYSVPRPMYAELTRLAGDRIIVSTASEEEWLDNIIELGWQLYLCSSPPYLIQTAATGGCATIPIWPLPAAPMTGARHRDSLDPVRRALKGTRPAEKPHAHQKYWQDLLGPDRGPRAPALSGTDRPEKAARAPPLTLRPDCHDTSLKGDPDDPPCRLQLPEVDRRTQAPAETPVGNQMVFKDSDLMVTVVGGPNSAPITTMTRSRSSSTSSRATCC
jgi:4-hydroxy-tetrahydrodipicolinate synthase